MSIKPNNVGIVGAGSVGAAITNALVLLGKPASIVLLDRTYGLGSEMVLRLLRIIGKRGIESRSVLPRNEVDG